MDPRAKIAATAALSILTLRGAPGVLALCCLGAAAVVLWARLSPMRLYKAMKPTLPFIAIIFLTHLFFTGGDPLFGIALGPLRITGEGFRAGALLAWRFALLVLAGGLLTETTPPAELTAGIERLLRPARIARVSSQDLALMISLALRFLPTLEEEMRVLREAQAARGAGLLWKGLTGRAREMMSLALPLSLAVFRRCDQLVEAMYARGYDGGGRTGLRGELSLSVVDRAVVVASVVMGAGSFLI